MNMDEMEDVDEHGWTTWMNIDEHWKRKIVVLLIAFMEYELL